jgi:hypothetical protein
MVEAVLQECPLEGCKGIQPSRCDRDSCVNSIGQMYGYDKYNGNRRYFIKAICAIRDISSDFARREKYGGRDCTPAFHKNCSHCHNPFCYKKKED